MCVNIFRSGVVCSATEFCSSKPILDPLNESGHQVDDQLTKRLAFHHQNILRGMIRSPDPVSLEQCLLKGNSACCSAAKSCGPWKGQALAPVFWLLFCVSYANQICFCHDQRCSLPPPLLTGSQVPMTSILDPPELLLPRGLFKYYS